MPHDVVSWGFFIFRKEDRMSEAEFYKCISKVTGESHGRLRQMGFQHVETLHFIRDKPFLNRMKHSVRRDPPEGRKAGEP